MQSVPSDKVRFIGRLYKERPEISQLEVFAALKKEFGKAIAPALLRDVKKKLGIAVGPDASKQRRKARHATTARAAGKAARRAGGKKAAGRAATRARTAKQAAPAPAPTPAPAASEPAVTPADAPRARGRGRRAVDLQKVTMTHLPEYMVVAVVGEEVHSFQSASRAQAKRHIKYLIEERGYPVTTIGFYHRSGYDVTTTVKVKF